MTSRLLFTRYVHLETRPGDNCLRAFSLRANVLPGDDFADEGLQFGWGKCDLQGFAEHGLPMIHPES